MIWEFRPEVFPLSTSSNAATLRALLSAAGVTLTRSSAATVQTSASTVVTSGIGVDDPRVGDAGYGPGLVLEESRTNILVQSRDRAHPTWNSGTGTVTNGYASGPDGTSVDRQVCTSGQFGHYQAPTVSPSTSYVSSQWARRGVIGVASSLGHYLQDSSTLAFASSSHALADAWGRYATPVLSTGASTASVTYSPCDGRTVGGLTASARDAVVDFAQIEIGKFATEAIVTTGASATRGADSLSLDTWNRLIRGGRIAMEWTFIPKASAANASNSMWLLGDMEGSGAFSLWIAFTVANTISFKYRSGGTPTSIAAAVPTWNPGDNVRVFAEFGNGTTYAAISINGGAKTVIGLAATVFDSIVGASFSNPNPRLMNYQNTAHMNCWLQRIRAFNPGRRPAWAA